jgi:hypothetical protein
MKRIFFQLLLSFLFIFSNHRIATSQTTDTALKSCIVLSGSLREWLSVDGTYSPEREASVRNEVAAFCLKMKSKRSSFKSEKAFLAFVFRRVHATFLLHYAPNEPFYKIFSQRTYNCVSGTALYALVLDSLGYGTIIRETQQHAYLLIEDSLNPILIESTDGNEGFVTNLYEIRRREVQYARSQQPSLTQPISLTQLCGLQYYNEAVRQFVKRDYKSGLDLLETGRQLYPDSAKISNLYRRIRKIQTKSPVASISGKTTSEQP